MSLWEYPNNEPVLCEAPNYYRLKYGILNESVTERQFSSSRKVEKFKFKFKFKNILLLPILQDNFWFTYIKYSIRFAEIHKQHSEKKQKLWMPLGIMISTSSARDTQRLCPNNIVYTEHINCEYTTYSPYSRFRFKYHMCISVKRSKGSWKPRWVYGLLGWYTNDITELG